MIVCSLVRVRVSGAHTMIAARTISRYRPSYSPAAIPSLAQPRQHNDARRIDNLLWRIRAPNARVRVGSHAMSASVFVSFLIRGQVALVPRLLMSIT